MSSMLGFHDAAEGAGPVSLSASAAAIVLSIRRYGKAGSLSITVKGCP